MQLPKNLELKNSSYLIVISRTNSQYSNVDYSDFKWTNI